MKRSRGEIAYVTTVGTPCRASSRVTVPDLAIAILEARKDIRIVFTDIDMPGSMDGLKLAHAIRKRWPPIELILTSGHFDVSDDEMPDLGRFFAKPYRDQEIISELRHFAV